jgi:hypothetical protein
VKRADLERSLDMIGEAVDWALKVQTLESERNAALHTQDKVMYSPICTMLDEARIKIEALRLAFSGPESVLVD